MMTEERSATREMVRLVNGRPVETLLRGYHELGWTQGRIAAELGVSRTSVNRWFREFGIQALRGRRAS